MPRFTYTGRDRAGSSVTDTLEAPSRRDVLRLLAARGLQVASVVEDIGGRQAPVSKNGSASRRSTFSLTRGRGSAQPTRRDRLPFLQSLHDLIRSGLSAGESVRLLSQRIKEPTLRMLCGGLWEKLSEGAPLSRALADYPAVFDSSTVNLIQAGEATGSLNDTVDRLIAHFTEQRELRRQLLSALAYPAFMVFVAGGVIPEDTANAIAAHVESGVADGVGNQARFNGPSGLAYDAEHGTLFVSDYGNHRIRKIRVH